MYNTTDSFGLLGISVDMMDDLWGFVEIIQV